MFYSEYLEWLLNNNYEHLQKEIINREQELKTLRDKLPDIPKEFEFEHAQRTRPNEFCDWVYRGITYIVDERTDNVYDKNTHNKIDKRKKDDRFKYSGGFAMKTDVFPYPEPEGTDIICNR